jgi:hypothetical protein
MTPAKTRTHAAFPRTHEAESSAAATPQPREERGGAPCLERVARKVRLVLIEGAEERGLGDSGAQRHAEPLNHKPWTELLSDTLHTGRVPHDCARG